MSQNKLEEEGLPDETEKLLADVWEFPLFEALFGRRARRFGFGGEIPDGPLQYKSEKDPLPLSELEQSLLIASAVGISGFLTPMPETACRRTRSDLLAAPLRQRPASGPWSCFTPTMTASIS